MRVITTASVVAAEEAVQAVRQAIKDAEAKKSKLPPDTLPVPGYSGKVGRHFLNNLAATFTPYVEVGCFMGSTLIAASYRNEGVLGIDNFTDETKPGTYMAVNRQNLLTNLAAWSELARPSFLDRSCWDVALEDVACCFFDGGHTEQDHFDSIDRLYPWFSQVFVFVVDDFNRQNVRDGTRRAINQRGLSIYFYGHFGCNGTDDTEGWWNGYGVYVLGK